MLWTRNVFINKVRKEQGYLVDGVLAKDTKT